jgi:hypothetical protein
MGAFSSPMTLREWPLTSPVVFEQARRPGPPHPLSRQETGIDEPRRLPSTSAPPAVLSHHRIWHRPALSRVPAPIVGSPPPESPLCHGRTGFRRSFTSPALSRREARPILVIHALFAHGRDGPHAACRLLQPLRSASTTTPARTPQHRTRGRPLVKLALGGHHLSAACRAADGRTHFREPGQSRLHGSEAWRRPRRVSRGSSHRDRSR